MAITFSNIGLAEPSTITNRVAAVTIPRGSTNEQQEILCLGDVQSSLGIAVVTDTTPASTAFGLVVREAVPQSTTVAVSSLGGVVSIAQNSTTFAVQLSQYSTTANVSSLAGRVLVDQNSTVWPTQVSSVAGVVAVQQNSTTWAVQLTQYSTTANVSSLAGRVLVDQNSTVWPTQVSSVAGVVAVQQNSTTWAVQLTQYSTTANVSSLAGRVLVDQNSTVWQAQVSSLAGIVTTVEQIPSDSTYASGVKASSGDTTLISSAATRIHVFGYHFSIASTTPTLVRLLSGSTVEMGRWLFQGPSSMSIGANLAVSSPSYLYRTGPSLPLVINPDSTASLHYSVQAYRQ